MKIDCSGNISDGEDGFFPSPGLLRVLPRPVKLIGRKCFWIGRFLLRSRAIRIYLNTHAVRKLHIGAGPNRLKGWLNTDYYACDRQPLVPMNAARPFPLPDAAFDYVFSEHLIEHLSYLDGLAMLRKCHRVLKPGGRIRIATPSLEILLQLFTSKHNALQEWYIKWVSDKYFPRFAEYGECFVINNAFRSG